MVLHQYTHIQLIILDTDKYNPLFFTFSLLMTHTLIDWTCMAIEWLSIYINISHLHSFIIRVLVQLQKHYNSRVRCSFLIFSIYFRLRCSMTIYLRCLLLYYTETSPWWERDANMSVRPSIHIRMYVYCHTGQLRPLRFHYL